MRVTLIGGGGLLGSHLVPLLDEAGHETTVASRSTEPRVDLVTGEGLRAAVEDAEVVVHLASDARRPRDVDVAGTQRLLSVLADQHLIYVSIVGVDRHPLPYYRAKLQAERQIADSPKAHSIVRATQFHDFIAYLLHLVTRAPVATVPSGWVTQPIDVREVASAIAETVERRPFGLQPDLAGPEVMGIEHLARTYMSAVGRTRPLLRLPVPGRVSRAFRDGVHTNPDRAVGESTWSQYLRSRYARADGVSR
jgi:uncharacterized protein YbjT (DUF2867 family)